jgi:hypothetical protein
MPTAWGGASRKIAQACERHLACMALVGQERPACRPISDCRQRHLDACRDVCVHGRRVAGAAGRVKVGQVATEGTTLQGHASRHNAMRSGYRRKAADRLRADMEPLGTRASQQDAEDDAALGSRRGDARLAALARRAARLAPIAAAMPRLEARAQADAEAERQQRAAAEAARQRTGTRRRGTVPQAVQEPSEDKAQAHCPAPEWQSMRTTNTGGAYGGKAHVSVEAASPISVACDVTAEAHDTQHAAPMAQRTIAQLGQAGMATPPDATGAAQKMPAPYASGDDSAAAVSAVEPGGCAPSMATGRQRHQASAAEAPEPPGTALERRAATVQTPEGRAWYARRKVIVAPVCGQSKAARGVRRLLRRGLDPIRGAGRLGCLTHNLRKLWRYMCAPLTV